MGRPSNTGQRRAEFLEAMLEVIAREGYRGATVAAVAQEAGLNQGLLHYHFKRKLEIVVALLERLAAAVEARAEGRLRRAGADPRARLLAYVDAHVALGKGADPRAVAAWVAIGAEAVREPEVGAVFQAAVEERLARLEAHFAAVRAARGAGRAGSRRDAAATLAAIEGAYRLAVAAPGALPRGFAAPALRRMVLGLLGDEA